MNGVNTIKFKIYFFLFILLGLVPTICLAETQIQVQENEINYDTTPLNPQPYSNVTISLTSYSTDLNKATITWQQGTESIISEIGKINYSFQTKGPNDPITINIRIRPIGEMTTISKQITIIPNEIELIWESVDSYTPPFYRGKALASDGSLIKVVALPNTNTIKIGKGSVTYTWTNAGAADLNVSGYNKNSYTFRKSLFDDRSIVSVSASSIEGNYHAENIVEIPAYKPKIVFYQKSLTKGYLYENALKNESLILDDEISMVAEPYFLAVKGNEADLIYNWKINGESIQTPSKKNELTLRPTSRGGYATIELLIENVTKLFQTVNNQLKVNL